VTEAASAKCIRPTSSGLFVDRRDAGRRLAEHLGDLHVADPVVLALPRGGVPVAAEVAEALGAPLEILAVRKVGAPGNPEYGVGAIAEDGTMVIDPEATEVLRIRNGELGATAAREGTELRRRVRAYRGDRPPPEVRGRTVVIVDDGAATGLTDVAAIRAVRRRDPRSVILALPVCSPEALELLRREADRVVCLRAPRPFYGVGQWYLDFSQVSDREVIDALGKPVRRGGRRPSMSGSGEILAGPPRRPRPGAHHAGSG
jgi:predicted phosphoribosyltransferase